MTLRSILAAAAAAILALPGAASAGPGASGRVSIDHVGFTLTDLDPNDGIAPSITFADPNGPGLAPATVFMFWSGGSGEVSAQGHEPITYSISPPGLAGGASVGGTTDPTTMDLSGYASVDGTSGAGYVDLNFWSSPLIYTLSPHTALTVTATVHFIGSASGPQDDLSYDVTEHAQIGLGGPDGWFSLAFPSSIEVAGGAAPVDSSVLLTGRDVNNGAGDRVGGLSLSGRISVFASAASVSPVPEPGRAALLGAGLPLLLLLGLRRRSHPDGGKP